MNHDPKRIKALSASILTLVPALAGYAEPFDTSAGNGYAATQPGQCTTYAQGRAKTINGFWFNYRTPAGDLAYPNARLMYDWLKEDSTMYRDTVPVRGGVVVWTGPLGEASPGHAAVVESVNTDGTLSFSEGNWGSMATKVLPLTSIQRRSSTPAGSPTVWYTLRGYSNPNRPTAIGTMNAISLATGGISLSVALIDEDKRNVSTLASVVDGTKVVSTLSKALPANSVANFSFGPTGLVKGRTYTLWIWTTDFRGLKASKSLNWKY